MATTGPLLQRSVMVVDDSGVFGCMTLLGCQDTCPKDLPLAAQIAFLRRRMAIAGI